MVIPAGSKGCYFGPLRDTRMDLARFAERAPILFQEEGLAGVRSLGLYVNSHCNLSCSHCYYQVKNGHRSASSLSKGAFVGVLEAALATDTLLFAFVGKEIFLPGAAGSEKTLAAMQFLAGAREAGRPLHMGAITNGILLDTVLDRLPAVGLDYLDISFDGADAASHDALRGPGAFAKSSANLALAIRREGAKKVFVASTLHRANQDSLAEILRFHGRYGARHFSLMPVVAIHDKSAAVSVRELVSFLSTRLPDEAAKLPPDAGVELVVDLDSHIVHRGLAGLAAVFEGSTVELDAIHNPILRRRMGGLELVLRISLPDPCNAYGCITHDGLYFEKGGCLIMKPGYEEHALGDVTREPIGSLMERHRGAATAAVDRFGADLFASATDRVLNVIEETTFYELPAVL